MVRTVSLVWCRWCCLVGFGFFGFVFGDWVVLLWFIGDWVVSFLFWVVSPVFVGLVVVRLRFSLVGGDGIIRRSVVVVVVNILEKPGCIKVEGNVGIGIIGGTVM